MGVDARREGTTESAAELASATTSSADRALVRRASWRRDGCQRPYLCRCGLPDRRLSFERAFDH